MIDSVRVDRRSGYPVLSVSIEGKQLEPAYYFTDGPEENSVTRSECSQREFGDEMLDKVDEELTNRGYEVVDGY